MATAIQPFESALEEIVRERKDIDAAEAAWLEKVAAYSMSGGWAADNYLSAAAAIGDHCHLTRTAAAAAVRLAVKLLQLPELAAAYAAGETSRAHVEVVARAYTRARAGEFDQHQDALALLAVNATPADLYQAVTKITDTIDGDGGAAGDDEIYEKRKLHSSKTMDGVRGSWFLDGEGGETVNAALDAQMETARIDDDPRTPAQRRADALVDICRFSLTFGEHPPAATKRRRGVPNGLMVIDIRMFEQNRAAFVADIRAEYATGGRISLATIERLLCDCDLSRVVMDGPSEVLDLGRSTRTPSDKQFKALIVRDGHCQAKGCKVPWQFCQPHHINWWTNDGPTDLDNLQLLCWHHHRQAHKHDAQARAG
ncbi:MAG TPA: DUF222 domain-containing protein [Acidimicrobiia bacterium]|nr:DUF222 domain-containing protein [Acidimicrobiia bacterium]